MLILKNLGSALAAIAMLSLGVCPAGVTAKPHGPHVSKHQPAKRDKLCPICKQYLERRVAWYRYKGSKTGLKGNRKATKALRSLPYAEQKVQCQTTYRAFDDFDHDKLRRC